MVYENKYKIFENILSVKITHRIQDTSWTAITVKNVGYFYKRHSISISFQRKTQVLGYKNSLKAKGYCGTITSDGLCS